MEIRLLLQFDKTKEKNNTFKKVTYNIYIIISDEYYSH